MTTYFDFRSETNPALHAFTDDRSAAKLPKDDGPWSLVRQVEPAEIWHYPTSRDAVTAGVEENGFFLWEADGAPTSPKPVIESDRVEGTAVYDLAGKRIGTIKRLLIEKVSGRVTYVDLTFGGFLGLGVHHYTIPWDKLAYDTRLGGYKTSVSEQGVRGAPAFRHHAEDQDWPDPKQEREAQEYWRNQGW